MQRQLQLAATIGMSAFYTDTTILHNDDEHLIYPLGGTLVIRNVKSGSQRFLQGHDNNISALDLSVSGTYLASGQITFQSFVADVVVWNLNTLEVLRRFKQHKTQVVSVGFSCDERLLVTAGGQDDNNIIVWGLEEGKALMYAHCEIINKVCFYNKDPTRFVSTHTTGQIRVWQIDHKLKKVGPLSLQLHMTPASTGHLKRQFSNLVIDFTDTFAYAASRSGDFMEIQLESATFTRIGPLKKMVGYGIRSLKYLKNGNFLIGGGDGSIFVVPRKDLEVKQVVNLGYPISSIVASSVSEVWITTQNSTLFKQTDLSFKAPCQVVLTSHPERINKIAFPIGFAEVFATCSVNDIRVWNSKTRKEMLRIEVTGHECLCLQFMPDGKSLISGWNDGKVRAFLPQSGKLFYSINEAHPGQVTAIAGTGDSKKVMSGGVEGQIRIWRIGKQTQMLDVSVKEHKGSVSSIQINGSSTRAVSCSSDGSCIVWDMESYTKIMLFRQDNNFQDARFSHDEEFVLTTGTNGIVRPTVIQITFWNWVKGKAVRRVNGADEEQTIVGLDINLQAIFESRTGEFFVTAGDEKIVKVWTFEEGELVAEGVAHFGRISDVQISPNNSFIVTSGTEGAIMIWRVPPEYQAEKPESEYGGTPSRLKKK